MLRKLGNYAKQSLYPGESQFLKRWPDAPKVALFAPPNAPKTEIAQRLSIDLGLPLVSVKQMLEDVAKQTGTTSEYSHPFYQAVKKLVQSEDDEMLLKEKIILKLLQLNESCQDGFVLSDHPDTLGQAQQLEEYAGGLNAFVHFSLPEEILVRVEENKYRCLDCGREYQLETIKDPERGIEIQRFFPVDGICYDCGSRNIVHAANPSQFEADLEEYRGRKDELLDFYHHVGLLVDFDMKKGFDDYDNLLRQVQYNIKF